jgi:hypothetical protein
LNGSIELPEVLLGDCDSHVGALVAKVVVNNLLQGRDTLAIRAKPYEIEAKFDSGVGEIRAQADGGSGRFDSFG